MPNVSMTAEEFLAMSKELEELKSKAENPPRIVPPQIIYKKSGFPWWLWLSLGVFGGVLGASADFTTKPQPGFGQGTPPNGPSGNPPTAPASPPATSVDRDTPLPPPPDMGRAPNLPPELTPEQKAEGLSLKYFEKTNRYEVVDKQGNILDLERPKPPLDEIAADRPPPSCAASMQDWEGDTDDEVLPKGASSWHYETKPEISEPVTIEMIDGKRVEK